MTEDSRSPDPRQTREQILQRDITFGEYIIAVCDAIGLPHDSPRAVVVEAIRAAVAAAQAPKSPTDPPPEVGRGGSGEGETATGAVPPPGVVSVPPRLVLIENDDRGGVRSRPETVDAIEAVLREFRSGPEHATLPLRLAIALCALDERWPT